jgi:hypothetical protein
MRLGARFRATQSFNLILFPFGICGSAGAGISAKEIPMDSDPFGRLVLRHFQFVNPSYKVTLSHKDFTQNHMRQWIFGLEMDSLFR